MGHTQYSPAPLHYPLAKTLQEEINSGRGMSVKDLFAQRTFLMI
jgi:hypothetical protein